MKRRDTGEVYMPDSGSQEVYQWIIEIGRSASEGAFLPTKRHNVLAEALGRDDHSGRLRGCSTRATLTSYYCSSSSTTPGRNANAIAEMRREMEMMRKDFDGQIQTLMEPMQVERPHSDQASSPESPHSLNNIPESTKVVLTYNDNDGIRKVARGYVRRMGDGKVHGRPILPGHVAIGVDQILYDGAEKLALPVPTDELVTLEDVVLGFTQWPLSHLLVDEGVFEGVQKERARRKAKVTTVNIPKSRPPCLQVTSVNTLLSFIDSLDSEEVNGFQLDILRKVYLAEEEKTFLPFEEIRLLATMGLLDISVLKIFQMYLYEYCLEHGIGSVGFVSPEFITGSYLYDSECIDITARTLKEYEEKKYVLAPYNPGGHWILLVFTPRENKVYRLNSLPSETTARERQMFKVQLGTILNTYRMRGGSRSTNKLTLVDIPCPRQPGSNECGYYVMKFMLEIVRRYHSVRSLTEVKFGTGHYMEDEVDEVRNLWAEYVLSVLPDDVL